MNSDERIADLASRLCAIQRLLDVVVLRIRVLSDLLEQTAARTRKESDHVRR